ncbi:MAG: hypothetical protein ACI89E_000146 [Planctomycetota bacterium]|jgi:hypothetical protein
MLAPQLAAPPRPFSENAPLEFLCAEERTNRPTCSSRAHHITRWAAVTPATVRVADPSYVLDGLLAAALEERTSCDSIEFTQGQGRNRVVVKVPGRFRGTEAPIVGILLAAQPLGCSLDRVPVTPRLRRVPISQQRQQGQARDTHTLSSYAGAIAGFGPRVGTMGAESIGIPMAVGCLMLHEPFEAILERHFHPL